MFPKIAGVASPADPEGKDGHGPPGSSEVSPEEFTDAKHFLFLQNGFLEVKLLRKRNSQCHFV